MTKTRSRRSSNEILASVMIPQSLPMSTLNTESIQQSDVGFEGSRHSSAVNIRKLLEDDESEVNDADTLLRRFSRRPSLLPPIQHS